MHIMLWDGGHAPSIESWRSIRDQVFSEVGASFKPHFITFDDGRAYDFVDASLRASGARVGCSINVNILRIDRPVCRLLFDLAQRARLFIFAADAPRFLRPPSLRAADLDRDWVPISDVDSAETLFRYFVPQPQQEPV